MRRAFRWLTRTLALALGLPLAAVLLVVAAMNTEPGRLRFEHLLFRITDGEVVIRGLSGRFPDALTFERLELNDSLGPWLVLRNGVMDWSPSQLLAGKASIDRLEAASVAFQRRPVYPPDGEETDWRLPIPLTLDRVHASRIDLSPPVLGQPAVLRLSGSASFQSLQDARITLTIDRIDRSGDYRFEGRVRQGVLQFVLDTKEPPRGLLSSWAGLPDLGALSLTGSLDGPLSEAALRLQLAAGPLKAEVRGQLDLLRESLDLEVAAAAPAMQPSPDVAWQSASLRAAIRGPFTRPGGTGMLRVDAFRTAGSRIGLISVEFEGDTTGGLQLHGRLEELRIPGPRPDLLQSAPVLVEAGIRLDQTRRPLTIRLDHPLLRSRGTIDTAEPLQGQLSLTVPDLAPLAAMGKLPARGHFEASVHGVWENEAMRLDGTGTLALTGGPSPWPDLLGDAAKFDGAVTIADAGITLSRLQIDGKRLGMTADGRYGPGGADFNGTVSLSDLRPLGNQLSGRLAARGRLFGHPQDLKLTAEVRGELSATPPVGGPVEAQIQAGGMPHAPAGKLRARIGAAGAPIELALSMTHPPGAELQLSVDHAVWKSARAQGAFAIAEDAAWPLGKLEVQIDRLEDIEALSGRRLTGSGAAKLETIRRGNQVQADLRLEASGIATADDASVGTLRLAAMIMDSSKGRTLAGKLNMEDCRIGRMLGSTELEFAGPPEALELDLTGTIGQAGANPVALSGNAVADTLKKSVSLSMLRASWNGETVRLLAPARLNFSEGVSVDRIRFGVRRGVVQVAGRLSPSFDLHASAQDIPGNLAGWIDSDLTADGSLNADATIVGPYDSPRGSLSVRVGGFRLRKGPWRGMPPAGLTVRADLGANTAQVDARIHAGPLATVLLSGRVATASSGSLDLHADGTLNLRLLDPLLTPTGRRVQGLVTSKTTVTGTVGAPRIAGNVRLVHGDLQDYLLGSHLADANALLQFEGENIRLSRFEGRMGPGKVTASGQLGWRAPGLPIDLKVAARNARPLSGERLQVTLNSDLNIRGMASKKLDLAGAIRILRAEIRIPERMPARIAVLNVSQPGVEITPPPATADFGLDLTLDAGSEVFVRGRGLDAELGGRIRLKGTAKNPEPIGSFAMRRGEFKLAGRTLRFSKGEVGFDGGTLTDPALDFVASTAGANVTATLAVGGTASKPKITLSSIPDLPQDEVLSHLLFDRSAASLSPLEMAQIAAALASLTGVTRGLDSPLEKVRQGLGLDRLSMGSTKVGPTLEAGRYVAPGVYLGAKQGFTGTTPQAAVQIDVTEGLKLEGTVGTGSPTSNQAGSSSVGVIYQFEY